MVCACCVAGSEHPCSGRALRGGGARNYERRLFGYPGAQEKGPHQAADARWRFAVVRGLECEQQLERRPENSRREAARARLSLSALVNNSHI